jgi:ubiquinone/menaquinone biosynthesis C-methylase UbiE
MFEQSSEQADEHLDNGPQNHRHEHPVRSSREELDAFGLLMSAGLAPGESFLDIGCGYGHFSIAASGIVGPETSVYAIDAAPSGIEMLEAEIIEKGIGNIRPEVMDAMERLPDPSQGSNGFRVILMSNVLHGFVANGEIEAVMKNIEKAHADNGRLMIVEFKKQETEFGPPMDIRLSEDDIEELFQGFGYLPSGRFEAGPIFTMQVLSRVC